jgi:hypothetical protein
MIVSGLIFLLTTLEIQASCLPESLVKQVKIVNDEIKIAEETVQRFESTITRDLPSSVNLVVRLEPLNPRVNAEIIHNNSSLTISILGGMLSHPSMNSSVLLMLLCHEVGHYLGGPPLKSRNGWSSTEGQADYFSALECLKNFELEEGDFLNSALELTSIYAEVSQQGKPSLESCDETIASRTNFGYPSAQCRLDTLLSGWRGLKRPMCWFVE